MLSNACSLHPAYTMSFSIVVFFLECAYLGYPRAWFMRALRAFHPKRDDVPWRDIVHIASTILGGISVQNSGSLIWLLCLAFQDLFPVLFFVLCTPVLLMA